VSYAQNLGLPEGQADATYNASNRYAYVDSWRMALAEQMKTQSPDMRAVAWKKRQLSDYTFRGADVQKKCQQIIADDTKWLMDHATRCDAFKDKKSKRGKRT
jgi:hypothetical protein